MKLVCDCGWSGESSDLLSAPDPFEVGGTITACPNCKDICSLVVACDEPGCYQHASCGTPTENGYRNTCHDHRPVTNV